MRVVEISRRPSDQDVLTTGGIQLSRRPVWVVGCRNPVRHGKGSVAEVQRRLLVYSPSARLPRLNAATTPEAVLV
jgi:hypothetical protein